MTGSGTGIHGRFDGPDITGDHDRHQTAFYFLATQELDPGGVELITRDVRIHPDFEGALLVNATLMNALPFAQPYPRIQFILYNVAGEIIAERTFEPSEYLQGSADLTHGMLPKVPVQAVLELLAAEQAAVSFEFRFL